MKSIEKKCSCSHFQNGELPSASETPRISAKMVLEKRCECSAIIKKRHFDIKRPFKPWRYCGRKNRVQISLHPV
ncbi:Uncharacterised protein [Vibrio cholerae]|nr:Uncharacterised protein [Vibrio cholerae]CSC04258.1 Uncharacterised protein [Vibrio cholerae]